VDGLERSAGSSSSEADTRARAAENTDFTGSGETSHPRDGGASEGTGEPIAAVSTPDDTVSTVVASGAAAALPTAVSDLTIVNRPPLASGPRDQGLADEGTGVAKLGAGQSVLRSAAQGDVVDPELGRADVGAPTHNGAVDARGTTQRFEAAAASSAATRDDIVSVVMAPDCVAALPSAVSDLTPANQPPADPAAGRQGTVDGAVGAAQSAINQAVLRNTAHGDVVHPELGRVEVSARMRDGAVDVQITTQRGEAASLLLARTDAMMSEVRAVNVEVGRMDIGSRRSDQDPPDTGAFGSNGGPGGGGGSPGTRRDPSGDTPSPPASRRVRIVL
jgi:hypothetical protein